jgi:REP element-mobilizing transposase RayT
MSTPVYYERNLPHYQPPNAVYLVNIRLAGSLPLEAFDRIRKEYESFKRSIASLRNTRHKIEMYRDKQLQYYFDVNRLLDSNTSGPNWLGRTEVAGLVAASLRSYDGVKYALLAFCIMPNHVHLVLGIGAPWMEAVDHTTENSFPITKCIGSVKKYTARKANKLLGRSGAFWQHESYDHVIRDSAELERILWYVIQNPVSAGMVKVWTDWKWTYLKEGLL